MALNWIKIDDSTWRTEIACYKINLFCHQFRTWLAIIEKPDGGHLSMIGGNGEAVRDWCEREIASMLGRSVATS